MAARSLSKFIFVILFIFAIMLSSTVTTHARKHPIHNRLSGKLTKCTNVFCPQCVCYGPPPPGSCCCKCATSASTTQSVKSNP